MSDGVMRGMPEVGALLRRAWRTNRALTVAGSLMVLFLLIAAVGLVADPPPITGQPAWAKPARFAISICVYSFTLLWLLTFVRGRDRLVRLISRVTAVALSVEMALIAGAAAAGTTSHFNFSAPVNTAVWMTMAAFIGLTWTMNLLTVLLLLRQRLADPAFAWSLRLGVLLSSVGMAVAFLMTVPTPGQRAAAGAGRGMPIIGAHSVGATDGGPGLPFTDWSTVGGDLRVPHFVGLHALQVLPLIGYLIARLPPGQLRPGHRVALIWTAGLVYLGVGLLLTWQALRGQSVVSPDALTVGSLLALLAAGGAVVVGIARHAKSGLGRSSPR